MLMFQECQFPVFPMHPCPFSPNTGRFLPNFCVAGFTWDQQVSYEAAVRQVIFLTEATPTLRCALQIDQLKKINETDAMHYVSKELFHTGKNHKCQIKPGEKLVAASQQGKKNYISSPQEENTERLS